MRTAILSLLFLCHCGGSPETLNSTGNAISTDTGTSSSSGGSGTSGGSTGGLGGGSSSGGSTTGGDPAACNGLDAGAYSVDAGVPCCAGLVPALDLTILSEPRTQCFVPCQSIRDCQAEQAVCISTLPRGWSVPADAGSICY